MTVAFQRNARLPLGIMSVGAVLFLGGCQSLKTAWIKADHAYADIVTPLGGLPPQAKALQGQPIRSYAMWPGGWNYYELGRRFEKGVGGLPQDDSCAAAMYRVAGEMPYRDEYRGPGVGVRPWTITYYGIPFARISLRRLEREGRAPVDPEAMSRCAEILAEAAKAP